jgi:transcription initiation factor TFIIIB Brf1 subunit/transcription initiation factor TFIIB
MTYASGVSACDVCGGDIISYEGEWVCRSCGVVPTHVDIGEPAFRAKGGSLTDLKEVELGSFLGSSGSSSVNGYSGLDFEFSTPAYMKTLSDFGLRTPTQKTQTYVLDMVARLGESMNLPRKAILDAQHMASIRLKRERIKKGSLPTLAAYCIVVAARRIGRSTVSWKAVSKNLSLMGHKVKLTSLISIATAAPLERGKVRMEEYLKDAARDLMMSPPVREGIEMCRLNPVKYEAALLRRSSSLLEALGRDSLSGYNPVAVSATLLYMAEDSLISEEGRRRVFTQKTVAEFLGVSEYTVREQTAKFKPLLRKNVGCPSPTPIQTDY